MDKSILRQWLATILIVVICPLLATAQNQTTVNISAKDTPVKTVLRQIESQTTYRFSYTAGLLDGFPRQTLEYNNTPVATVLDKVFGNSPIAYDIVSPKAIALYKRGAEPRKTTKGTKAGKTVKGQILDSTGEPVIGATVWIKGTQKRMATNIDGEYSFADVEPGQEIVVTSVGYDPTSIAVGDKETYNLTLDSSANNLDEVIVVGYGVQKKINLSGSVSTLSAKKLEDRPVVNVGQALQGQVANLNVNIGSGQANASPSYNIRGTTSLNGGSPLIVIDGVVSSAWTLNNMNPNDIENISILKDAASAAIYGSRAAFGVILVTTKTGNSEKVKVTYLGNVQARHNVFKPEIISDPYEVAQMRNTMSYPWYNLYNEEQLAYAKKVSEDPSVSPYYLNPNGTYSYFGSTDWVNEAYKNYGLATGHNLSVSGKTKKADYLISAGYAFTDGLIKYDTDKHRRYNTRIKVNADLTDWWKVGANMALIAVNYDRPQYLGSDFFWNVNRCNPMDVIYNPDGSYTKVGASLFGRIGAGRTKQNGMNLNTRFNTRIDILKNVLWLTGVFSYTYDNDRNRGYSTPVQYKDGPDRSPLIHADTSTSWAETTSSETKNYSYDAYATFHKTFADRHEITVMAGFNQENSRYEYLSASRDELISSSLPSLNLSTGEKNMSESITTWAVRSGYGRINYILDNKYIFEFNGRYDGTSRFPRKDRYTFNPSGSVAWVFSREKFMSGINSWFSHGKIRYSYGTLGNQDVSAYAYIATMGSGKISQILDGTQPVYVSAPGLVSGSLTWEKVTTSNIGIDLGFFNNRLMASADIYTRWTKDMLTSGMPLPNVLGTSVPQQNAADLRTKGWELNVSWNDNFILADKPFNYNIGFNLADSQAKITKFDNEDHLLSQYYDGYEIGTIWGLTTEGFFTSQEDIDNHADQSRYASYLGTRPLAPGDIKFKDINGDGVINNGNPTMVKYKGQKLVQGDAGWEEARAIADRDKGKNRSEQEAWYIPVNSEENHGDWKKIGNSGNHYTFGINLGADWNNFDLSMFFQGVGKRDYAPGSDLYFAGIYAQPWTNITYGNFYDHWTEENPDAYFPRPKAYAAESSWELGIAQTRYIQRARYIRLKNLTFGYTIPSHITAKAGIEKVRVYFSGDNIFTHSGLYKHYKVDPEGLGGQSYPLQRTFSFGLNVNF